MNVPEALNATRRAIDVFAKTVEVAREELGAEMSRIHSQLLEEQPKETARDTSFDVPYERRVQ